MKCKGYFNLIPNVPEEQKVTLVAMHLEDKALTWFENFTLGNMDLTWEQFIATISDGFDDLKEGKNNC